MSGTRSLNGCHTCRLRKKKCDELHPACANCLSRAIPCYGYGPKPHWMDGAGLEAEQVKKIKKAAESNYRARRRGWRPNCKGLDVGGVDMSGVGTGMKGIFEEVCEEKALDEDVKELEDPGTGHVMLWEGDLEPQYSSDLSAYAADEMSLSLRPKALEDGDFSFEKMFPSRVQPEPEPEPEPYYQTQFSTEFASKAAFPTTPASKAVTSTRLPPSPRTLSFLWYQSNFGTTYNVSNNAELDLLMHYLDNVFCLQYGFSCLKQPSPTSDRGRGWYLDTLLLCKPLYFATLSVSAYHQHLVKGGDFATSWAPSSVGSGKGELAKVGLNWEAERNFVMALKGLQAVIDEVQGRGLKGMELLKARWQVLGIMCQVLSLEVFRTLGGNWPIHIQAARTFLSMMGSSSFSPCPSSQLPNEAPKPPPRLDILEQILKDDRQQFLSHNNTRALKHFVTAFIWVDILSRASGLCPSPSNPSPLAPATQPFDYLHLLEDSTLDLSCVMGCENWVFIGLARIITLASSMRAPRDQGHHPGPTDDQNSSALDPHSQATVLEAIFERGIRGLREARAKGEPETRLEMHSSLVTELFALAAVAYLHVTMSGALPFLPAVRTSVRRTVAALCALPEELLIRVSWPFAVAGCMVLEEEREAVRGVVARAQSGGFNIGTVWKGMLVVEECWRLRDAAGEVAVEVSWVEAMESLGEKILLC